MPRLLPALQAVRLKGRATAAEVGLATGAGEAAGADALARLVTQGALEVTGEHHRLTPAGSAQLAAWLAAERSTIELPAIAQLGEEVGLLDARITALARAARAQAAPAQAGTPGDAGGSQLLGELAGLQPGVAALVRALGEHVPRLEPYGTRLEAVLEAAGVGAPAASAPAVVADYQAVWAELAEELRLLLTSDAGGGGARTSR